MVIRKVLESGSNGSLIVTIPSKFAKELGIKKGDYVNISKVGVSLHLTKVTIE